MEEHFSLNSDDGTIECRTCGKQLASNASLIDHHRTHTGERPYACTICNKRFTQKAHLIIHKRTHTGEKPYACAICHKRFAQSSHLKNHKRIHTGEKAYLCSICNTGFSRKPRLEQHLEEHILHNALAAKSKKAAAEREAKQVMGSKRGAHGEGDEKSSLPLMRADQTGHPKGVVRKRKPTFVTRVCQEDRKVSARALEDHENVTLKDGKWPVKSEPTDNLEMASAIVQNSCMDEDEKNVACGGNYLLSVRRESDLMTLAEDDTELRSVEGGASSTCDVSSTDPPGALLQDDGDQGSVTGDSYNSSEQTNSYITQASHRSLLHAGNHGSRPGASYGWNSSFNRTQNSSMSASAQEVSHSQQRTAPRGSNSYYRANTRLSLIDFSTEDLIIHLMSRDGVFRCDYCCSVFQDGAMYHLHRSMHDKIDIRCCNLCGKQSVDKYDFLAHFLSEHK